MGCFSMKFIMTIVLRVLGGFLHPKCLKIRDIDNRMCVLCGVI